MIIDMKQEYEDWIALLKRTKNEELLKDPYNIWIEAFTIATVLLSKEKTPTEAGVESSVKE
jgi:hypothetical protein